MSKVVVRMAGMRDNLITIGFGSGLHPAARRVSFFNFGLKDMGGRSLPPPPTTPQWRTSCCWSVGVGQ